MANKLQDKRLIVNADDFGRSSATSLGIIRAHRRGIVTSASLMTNMSSAREAVKLARKHKTLSVGLHINLTYGSPVSNPRNVKSLVDADGYFLKILPQNAAGASYMRGSFKQRAPIFDKRASFQDIEREINSQVTRFKVLNGFLPSHINTHHHIHSSRLVFHAIRKVAQNYDIPVRQINVKMKAALRRYSIGTPDHFIDDSWHYMSLRMMTTELQRLFSSLRPGVTEALFHPGYTETEPGHLSALHSEAREVELKVLCAESVKKTIKSHDIQLIGYGEL